MPGRIATLIRRLERIERAVQSQEPSMLRVHWPDEFLPCLEHRHCEVEVVTGIHHAGVIHLSFEERASQ